MNENVENFNIEDDFDENDGMPVIVLTDDDTGEETEYLLRAKATIDGVLYYALKPADEEGEEYGILKVSEDGDDIILETIEDDDEFEKVEDYFNDLFFGEIDYDEDGE